MVRVETIMKRDVISVNREENIFGASMLMRVLQVGSVLVKDGGQIIGIVTEADIVRKVVSMNRIPEHICVEEIMSSPVVGIDQYRPIFEAADMMEQHGTRHLAVTDQQDVVGVLSVRDLLHPVAVDDL